MSRDPAQAVGKPVAQLQRIAFLLERAGEPSYRVRAFRNAAATLQALPAGRLTELAADGRVRELPGVGESTEQVVLAALAGRTAAYLQRWEPTAERPVAEGGAELCASIRGDCHSHSDWSDGGSPVREMALTARELGHEWTALTDHSPRLTIAHGLSRDRLERQLELVAAVNAELAPFRLLTGIEVDILDDGSLDQDDDLLAQLDLVVASVHSSLRMATEPMTQRLAVAVSNPDVDVLGHCTGRLVRGRGRPESTFDADLVFEACRRFGVAVEVNSRPERRDPPTRLLRLAVETGCLVAIDTDAHAPGQLDWQPYGCERAAACGVDRAHNVTSWPLERLRAWTADHQVRGRP